jgi:hypothetical protein
MATPKRARIENNAWSINLGSIVPTQRAAKTLKKTGSTNICIFVKKGKDGADDTIMYTNYEHGGFTQVRLRCVATNLGTEIIQTDDRTISMQCLVKNIDSDTLELTIKNLRGQFITVLSDSIKFPDEQLTFNEIALERNEDLMNRTDLSLEEKMTTRMTKMRSIVDHSCPLRDVLPIQEMDQINYVFTGELGNKINILFPTSILKNISERATGLDREGRTKIQIIELDAENRFIVFSIDSNITGSSTYIFKLSTMNLFEEFILENHEKCREGCSLYSIEQNGNLPEIKELLEPFIDALYDAVGEHHLYQMYFSTARLHTSVENVGHFEYCQLGFGSPFPDSVTLPPNQEAIYNDTMHIRVKLTDPFSYKKQAVLQRMNLEDMAEATNEEENVLNPKLNMIFMNLPSLDPRTFA